MKITKTIFTVVALSFLVVQGVLAASGGSETGNLRIIIKSAEGEYIPKAPIYLYDGEKMHYVESSFLGAASLELKYGKYVITSAISKPVVDGTLRFASPEAHVFVQADDSNTVVLTLHPVDTRIEDISTATLQKIGVADEVAKYLN